MDTHPHQSQIPLLLILLSTPHFLMRSSFAAANAIANGFMSEC